MLANQIRFYLITALLGGLVGLLGTAFQVVIVQVEHLLVFASPIHTYLGVLNIPLVMLMVFLAWLMVIKIAPQACGSGIQEIEAYLIHQRQIYWKRLIPVKFILPLMVSCLSACMVAQLESNSSIYSRFLQKLLNQQKLN